MINNQISTIPSAAPRQANEVLIKLVGDEVLPALKAYYPASDFNWRGNIKLFANEYAGQLCGLGLTTKVVRTALKKAQEMSTSERNAPNPLEFKILCLQAAGMPTLDSCMREIDEQRIRNYGKQKEWSQPIVYWLNQRIAASRATLKDSAWRKQAEAEYTKLAELYGKGELSPIPKMVEYKAPPAYLKYAGADR